MGEGSLSIFSWADSLKDRCVRIDGIRVADYIREEVWIDLVSIDPSIRPIQVWLSHIHILSVYVVDEIFWSKSPSWVFSVAHSFQIITMSLSSIPFWAGIWNNVLIQKINIFFYLFMQEKVLTIDNLCKRGMAIPNRCVLCKESEENFNHILLHCSFSTEVWVFFLQLWEVRWTWSSSIRDCWFQWVCPLGNPSLRVY